MPASIQDVYLQFDPLEPLEANDRRYVDCMQERGLPALFQHLRLPLAGQPRPLLFSGHFGDGKTTILKQLQGQLEREERDFVAFGEMEDRLNLSDVEYDDVLLATLAVVDQTLRERFQEDMEANPFQHLWQELSRIAHLQVQLDKFEVSLGPFGKMVTIVKDSPDARLQVRQRLREARSPTFLGVVNDYLRQAQAIVQRHGHRQLVVILDGLDRLSETPLTGNVSPDERLFLGQRAQLLGVHCHVIYTVRLALVRSQGTNLMNQYGQQPLVVPMIPVRQPDGTPHEAGMEKLREIIGRRLNMAGTDLHEAFTDMAAVDRLCRASSGHLRELMTLMRNACAAARAAHPELPLTTADVSAAIRNLGALRRTVAPRYAEALRRVSQTHRLDGIPDDVQQALLHQYLVYEYFSGEHYWYDISALLHGEKSGNGE